MASEITVEEKIVVNPPVIVSEAVVIPAEKGDPGEDFTYEDFTPEQIADLQRPATEAAEAANEAASNANNAAENVSDKIEEANTAISDAKSAAGVAVSAAWNADKAATAANNSATLANEAAEKANQAAESIAYKENGFYISPYYLEATDLRYIGFKDIADDTTCYILTVGRCLKFDLNTYEVFWDVKLQGYGISWHNAAEQLRIIDDIVYIVCANWGDREKGVHLVKLNDTDGSFISDELIPIPIGYGYSSFRGREVLITRDFIVGIDTINKNIIKCNLQDLSTEIISPYIIVLGNRWITTPDGSVVYSLCWGEEKNVIKVLDDSFNLYTITLSFNNTNTDISRNSSTCLYSVDLKNKRINLFNWDKNKYVITLTDDGDNNFSAINIFPRTQFNSDFIPPQCYANNISTPNYSFSNLIIDTENTGIVGYLSNKSKVFKPNINNLMLAANLCGSGFGGKYEIEKINTLLYT